MTALALLSGAIGIAACIDDLRRGQISNWISGGAFASGLALATVQHGWRGMGAALLGTLAGGGVFLVFYMLGGMGGGDVKLMAGFGAVLGVKRLFEAALWTSACGGVMAAAVIASGIIRNLWRRGKSAETEGSEAGNSARPLGRTPDTIPYAPAITAGVWLSLVTGT